MLLGFFKRYFSNSIRFFSFKKYINNKFGLYGEYLVVVFLFFKGYKLIRHRYRNIFGEIDLIFLKNKTLVFVEVKSRIDNVDYFGLISNDQKRRIIKSAGIFTLKYDQNSKLMIRFDLCVVTSLFPCKIRHIQDIWGI